ncbi:transmembrane protein 180-like [Glandiceps talaboti]
MATSGQRSSVHWNAVAFSASTLASAMMNSVFQFYYVKLFLNHYHISQPMFHWAQIIYSVWNAVNDPLCGYFQDNSKLDIFRVRRLSILYGAPLFALSFLLPWFPWQQSSTGGWLVGLHLLVSLCCYDALFTFVLLAHCAIFTEMSKQHSVRLRLIRYSRVASMIGSTAVLFSEVISDSLQNMNTFRTYCVVIAILSWWFLRYTGKNVTTHYDIASNTDSKELDENKATNDSSIWKLSWQIIKQKNFLLFVMMNFCQVFHVTYRINFLAIFGDALIPQEDVLPVVRKFVYGSAFLLPQMLTLLGSNLVGKLGSYRVILASFYIKVGTSVFMFCIGRSHTWFLTTFLLVDVALSSAIFSLFNMPLADIIDEDVVKHKRKSPLSSMVFGTNALFTKPAQSIAPIMVVSILNTYDYQSLVSDGHVNQGSQELFDVMFTLVCVVPMVMGALQILIWSRYQLKNCHLQTSQTGEKV